MTTTVIKEPPPIIIKQPLPADRDEHRCKPVFPSMPMLYLEYLGNTDHVRKKPVEKDFVQRPVHQSVPTDDICMEMDTHTFGLADANEYRMEMFNRRDRELDDFEYEQPPKKVARFDGAPSVARYSAIDIK